MRSARIHRYGDASVIRIEDITPPVPRAGEVMIEVAATSFNPTEVALRSGLDGGAAAECVAAPAARIVPVPRRIPLADAAAVPLAGLTAWQFVVPHVRAGQRVLVNGAGGGDAIAPVDVMIHLVGTPPPWQAPRSGEVARSSPRRRRSPLLPA